MAPYRNAQQGQAGFHHLVLYQKRYARAHRRYLFFKKSPVGSFTCSDKLFFMLFPFDKTKVHTHVRSTFAQ
jgi:hypothetical protein